MAESSAAANTSATFGLNLESNIPSTASGVASSLEQLRMAFVADTAALRGLQLEMAALKGSGQASAESLKALSTRISAQKTLANSSRSSYLGLGGAFDKLKPKAKEAATGIDELQKLLQGAGGPLGQYAGQAANIGKALATGPGVLVAVAAGMVLVTAAAAAGAAALAAYGIAAADARRSEALRLEGLSKYRNFWQEMIGFTRKADSGAFLQQTVDNVSGSVSLAREEVGGLVSELYKAGLRGGNLQAASEGMAIALATQGEAGAAQFKSMALNAQLFGGSVKKLSDEIKARLGGIALRQMLSLGVQQKKMRENMAAIFGGLKLEGFLTTLKLITDQFSQTTSVGRALKALAETLLQPLLDWVASHGMLFKRFFQGLTIGAMLFGFAVLDLRDKLAAMFGGSVLANVDGLRLALDAGAAAASLLFGSLVAVGLGLALLVAPFALVGAAIYGLVQAVQDIQKWFSQDLWHEMGANIVIGLVNGITGGAATAVQAAIGLAKAVRGAFQGALDMHSPSRAMFEDGQNAAKGSELGLRAGTPGVASASDDMAEAARVGTRRGGSSGAAAADGSSGSAGSQILIQFGEKSIVIEAGGTAKPADVMAGLKAGIVELLRDAAAKGLAPA